MTTVLITGATGTVGRALVHHLLDRNIRCLCPVRDLDRGRGLWPEQENLLLLPIPGAGSLTELKAALAVHQPPVVLHFAAHLTGGRSPEDIDRLIESNLRFGTRLLDALAGQPPELFVNCGSFAEYSMGSGAPDPASLYAATKTAFHPILNYYQAVAGFQILDTIPATIYGSPRPETKIFDLIMGSVGNDQPVALTDGRQELDFIHLDDIVAFFVNLLAKRQGLTPDHSRVYLGTGRGTSLRKLAALAEVVTGRRANIKWGALPRRERNVKHVNQLLDSIPDNRLGWLPKVTLEEGIARYFSPKPHHE